MLTGSQHQARDHAVATNIFEGLDDVRKGRFSSQSILDVHDED